MCNGLYSLIDRMFGAGIHATGPNYGFQLSGKTFKFIYDAFEVSYIIS